MPNCFESSKELKEIGVNTREESIYYVPPNFAISDEVKERIIRNHIEPHYQQEVTYLIKGKRDWKFIGQLFETTSKILVTIGGVVSFAAGFYDIRTLSFVAGAVSSISLATLAFSSFGYKEQKKQGVELNNILKKLKLDDVPLNERSIDELNGSGYANGSPYARQSVQSPQTYGSANGNNPTPPRPPIQRLSSLDRNIPNSLREDIFRTELERKEDEIYKLVNKVMELENFIIKEKEKDKEKESSTSTDISRDNITIQIHEEKTP